MTVTAKSDGDRVGVIVAWVRAVRPVHWSKNLLLAVPAIFAHADLSLDDVWRLAIGFVLLSLIASAGYIINDLCDLPADRQHRIKRARPFASGALPTQQGMLVAGGLVAGCLGAAAALLGPDIALLLAVYLGATVAYSAVLKKLVLVDVLALSGLYLWRLVIGGALLAIPISPWLAGLSYCLFVALALAKRGDELSTFGGEGPLPARGYRPAHRRAVFAGCALSAVLAVAVLVAYIGFGEAARTYYRHPGWLWPAALLLALWLGQIIQRAAGGRLRGDPVVFAMTDPVSLCLAAGVGASLIAAA